MRRPSKRKSTDEYRINPEFRQTVKERAKVNYRKKQKEFELTSCLRSLDYFEDDADFLPVQLITGGPVLTLPVYRLMDVAELLQTNYQTLWRWTTKTNLVPTPIYIEKSSGRNLPVYHREEVRVLLTVIGKHMQNYRYYRVDHSTTQDKLASRMEETRKMLKDNEHDQIKSRKARKKRT